MSCVRRIFVFLLLCCSSVFRRPNEIKRRPAIDIGLFPGYPWTHLFPSVNITMKLSVDLRYDRMTFHRGRQDGLRQIGVVYVSSLTY